MELIDFERYGAPAGGDALRGPTERLGDLTKRADPVRPPRWRQLVGLFDRRDGVGEGGFKKSVVVH
jgi:hypothetical protein